MLRLQSIVIVARETQQRDNAASSIIPSIPSFDRALRGPANTPTVRGLCMASQWHHGK